MPENHPGPHPGPRHGPRHRAKPAPRPPRATWRWRRHIRAAALVVVSLSLVAVLGVVAWRDPQLGVIGLIAAVALVAVRWTPGYVALRGELEATRRRLDSVNTSQNADDLAAGVHPAQTGGTPTVQDPTPTPTPAPAPPPAPSELVPQLEAAAPPPDGLWLGWCVQLGDPTAPWCALDQDEPPVPGDPQAQAETVCGFTGYPPLHIARRHPDCLECLRRLGIAHTPAAPLAPSPAPCGHFGHGAGPCPWGPPPALGIATAEGPLSLGAFIDYGAHVAADGVTHAGPPPHDVEDSARRCRVCGCSQQQACWPTCRWVEDPQAQGPLCSACLPRVEAAMTAPFRPDTLPDVPVFTTGQRR